ncbi:MAG: nitrogen fixation protein FixH [Pedobacter sp.]|nr:MAG: nitrogen fixation protein FixH [Pedobacter sp.]
MNWGTKLVLGLATFMLFVIGMVVYMFSVHGNDSLVDEDYYEKGLDYNKEYDAKTNTITDKAEPIIKVEASKIIIQLKDSATYELKINNASKAKEDKSSKGNTIGDANLIIVDTEGMKSGLWALELKWESNQKKYQFNKNITL